MLDQQINQIHSCFVKALAELGAPADTPINLERPRQAANGDLACTVALQLAKAMKKNPRQIGTQLAEILQKDPEFTSLVSDVAIAGPGFINMKFSDDSKQRVIKDILAKGEHYGDSDAHKGQSVILEYVSANPTGPLHLGHARQGALGDVLANIFKTQGWNVTREFYYNDAGVQIHNLAISVQCRAKEIKGIPVEFPEDGYRGDYIYDIARDYTSCKPIETFDGKTIECDGDIDNLDEIRKYAVAYLRNEQHQDLNALGVDFDNFYLESSLYTDGLVERAVQAVAKAGKTYEKDGALWFRSTDYGDDLDRVMRKKDGGYTYFVPDVAYHLTKFERGFTKAIDIQGSDHFGTCTRVRGGIQAAASQLGLTVPVEFPQYMLHKMLHVLMDGKEVKMSKRAGTYITLRDLVDWVGKDAARLFLVNRKCDAEFNFDVDLARSQSDENPVYYLQYAHARICSVLKLAEEKGYKVPTPQEAEKMDLSCLNAPTEQTLMLRLAEYPKILAYCAEELSPHTLANYLKELAADFHSFYNAERVITDNEAERNARFALLLATRQVLRNGLKILGVSAPERMDREPTP